MSDDDMEGAHLNLLSAEVSLSIFTIFSRRLWVRVLRRGDRGRGRGYRESVLQL